MAITAADIHNASFSIDRKGYDVDEVDVFLERVADEIDAMNNEIADLQDQLDAALKVQAEAPAPAVVPADVPASASAAPAPSASDEEAEPAVDPAVVDQLRAQVAQLKAQLDEKSANDAAISQAIIVAQRSADQIVANARTEATGIVNDAEAEADRIAEKAEADRQRIIEAIRKLEADRSDVCGEYREALADFMADAQRKLADLDAQMRQAAANSQTRTNANAVSYAPVETLLASGVHVAGAPVPASAAPAAAGADPMYGGVPSETVAAAPVRPVTSPSASGFIDKDFSGYGAADDDIEVDID